MSKYLERILSNPKVSLARKVERADGRMRKLRRAIASREAIIEQCQAELDGLRIDLARLQIEFGVVETSGDPGIDNADPCDLVALQREAEEIKCFSFSENDSKPTGGGALWTNPIPETPARLGPEVDLDEVWPDMPMHMRRALTVPGYAHASYVHGVEHLDPAELSALEARALAEGRAGLPLQIGFCDKIFDLGVATTSGEKFKAIIDREMARGRVEGEGPKNTKKAQGEEP